MALASSGIRQMQSCALAVALALAPSADASRIPAAPSSPSLDAERLAAILGLSLDGRGADEERLEEEPVSTCSWILLGTLVSRRQVDSLATLFEPATGKVRTVRAGQQLGEARILHITREAVDVTVAGRRERVCRAAPAATNALRAPPTTPPPKNASGDELGRTIQVLAPDHYEIPGAERQRILEQLPLIAGMARAAPVIQDGTMVGLRLLQLRQGSVFGHLGLQAGDVVLRIDGRPLSAGPHVFLDALQRLEDAARIDVELERQGAKRRLRYDLR